MIELISRLPIEYQEVEYIESSGTQYIDEEFRPSGENVRILTNYMYRSSPNGKSLFGAQTSDTTATYPIVFYHPSATVGHFDVGSSIKLIKYTVATNVRYLLDCHANNGAFTAELNGDKQTATYSGSLAKTLNMFMFANNHQQGTEIIAARLYARKIWDNDELVRDYVPCYRKADNVAGLYDLVTGTFFANAGSGTFAVGNKHGEWVITAGGIIPMQYALRRMMMQSNEKTWTVTIQNKAAGDASPYYPKINGIASGPGIYKVRDGDVITLYGHVGAYEEYYVSVIYIDGHVWHANYGQTISQQHIARTDCNIVISSEFSHGYNYITNLTTT